MLRIEMDNRSDKKTFASKSICSVLSKYSLTTNTCMYAPFDVIFPIDWPSMNSKYATMLKLQNYYTI